jgi:hypothetical protein
MPAFTRRWTKTSDKPSEQSFECKAYDTEVVSPAPDASEAQAQLRHANQQLAIVSQYPGRGPPRVFKLRAVK